MKHLRKFNEELNKSTYISAANKLRKMGGNSKLQRAEELEKHAQENGDEYDIHNIHYHQFTLQGEPGYLINSYKVERNGRRSRCYITVFMYDPRGDKKSITIELTYYGDNGWACSHGQHDNVSCISDNMMEMWLNYYDENEEDVHESSEFLFENRKDAMEFKKFVIDFLKKDPEYSDYSEEMEAISGVSANQMTE
jgi:hypothetical protein